MDFDTMMRELLIEEVGFWNLSSEIEVAHLDQTVTRLKQLIESKQPEKKKDLRDSLKGEYAHRTAYADGYNDALTAWREGMGLS